MDPITHTMAGAVIARAGGDRKTALAAATLMLAANAPDIDIYTVWTETSFGSIALASGSASIAAWRSSGILRSLPLP